MVLVPHSSEQIVVLDASVTPPTLMAEVDKSDVARNFASYLEGVACGSEEVRVLAQSACTTVSA